jgi:LCP family protein required for cell wall assembly
MDKNKSDKKKLSKTSKILVWAIAAVALVTVIVLAAQGLKMPLAPTLNVVTATPDLTNPTGAATLTPIYVVVTSTPSGENPTTAATTAPTALAAPQLACNESGNMNLLLIGVNEKAGVWPPGAEMIRVINVDYDNQTIEMVAFPRDLYVPTSGLASSGMTQQTLGLTYYYAKQSVRGDAKSVAAYGASMLARTLLEDFDVHVDYYMVVDASVVPSLIDKVGGVEIELPASVTGYNNVTFPAGRQVLSGAQALNFVSFKSESTEDARYVRQQMVMDAFLEKAISLDMIPRIPSIVSELGSTVITDLSVDQLSSMGCLAKNMDRSRIGSYSLQYGTMVYVTSGGVLLPNTPAIIDFANDYLE